MQECETTFSKKCDIVLREVEYNETVTRCVRPLHRVCTGDRVKREVNNMEREEDSSEGPSCKYYNETVCIKKGTDTNGNSQYKEECQLLEVKHKVLGYIA